MIGVFDSGFGGLTILKELKRTLPNYDFLYLGDNARAPYGTRSFETIFRYTLESVEILFEKGCPLVILACNTASAKALRTIQQEVLPKKYPTKRVLGIVRPTAEEIGKFSKTGHIGIFATAGTVSSGSYAIEIAHHFPHLKVTQYAPSLWVPLVESGELNSPGTDFFVKKEIDKLLEIDPEIDTILLACTHYPLLLDTIKKYVTPSIQIVLQGSLVAEKTKDYLKRHPEIDNLLPKNSKMEFLTSDTADFFEKGAFLFGMRDIFAKSLTF